jgi:hypothetical protein
MEQSDHDYFLAYQEEDNRAMVELLDEAFSKFILDEVLSEKGSVNSDKGGFNG